MNRFQTRLTRMVMLGLMAALVGATSIAQAESARWAWTKSKARQVVIQRAAVQAPGPLKRALASELQAGARLYSALELAAIDGGDGKASSTFRSLKERYRRALETLRTGLQIDAADCTGLGVPRQGKRFARFRCPVTSAQLEIPSVELDYRDGELPSVVEGPPRVEGPFQALLDVRVVGKSAIAYRQMTSS
jgi:hypothetical protein